MNLPKMPKVMKLVGNQPLRKRRVRKLSHEKSTGPMYAAGVVGYFVRENYAPALHFGRTGTSQANPGLAPNSTLLVLPRFKHRRTGPPAIAVDDEEVKQAAQLETERQERLRALNLMFGAWKGRTDIPNDGLVFQEELRSE